MKLLIGYDGSTHADAALADLARAGLPPEVEAVVLTVADVWLPPGASLDEAGRLTPPEARGLGWDMAHRKAREAVSEARGLAEQACARVQAMFPSWEVRAEAGADSPAWGLIKKADAWKPDLIVVGSRGRSGFERVLLGSVSERVVAEARCSVRVGRTRPDGARGPVRIVVGVDGSPGADAAVAAVCERAWPPGSEAEAVAVLDPVMRAVAALQGPAAAERVPDPATAVAGTAAARLRAAGLAAVPVVREGDPRSGLLEEVARWRADCLFVGARGLRGVHRFLLGSVSTAVVARAPCSVEVVRRAGSERG